jgi:hypothetical protein
VSPALAPTPEEDDIILGAQIFADAAARILRAAQ